MYFSGFIEIILLLSFQVSRENTQPENICDIVFEKAKSRGGTINRRSVYAESAV